MDPHQPYAPPPPWDTKWSKRAPEAIEGFRRRERSESERVADAENPASLAAAAKRAGEVEVFGTIERLFDEKNGDWTLLMRSEDKSSALRVRIAKEQRAAFAHLDPDGEFLRLDKAAFAASPSESIDYAVMEKTDAAMVLPVDIGWNDVGSWSALWEVSEQDGDGNAHHGDVIAVDSRNNYAYARGLVALVGVDDLIVVETDDAVLVAARDKVQEVKQVVARLKAEQRSHAVLHREVQRPWGSYDSVDVGAGFQVKRIKVKPGATLSLQSHERRAEHWIVVRGTARVTRNNDVFELFANQSTYIPIGAKHRLENPGTEMLELIEVQSGDYLGEDDIVRYEDVYGRG